MTGKHKNTVDNTDLRILDILQSDCRIPLEEIAARVGIPKSTVHYRIKRLEKCKIVKGYHGEVDPTKVGRDFLTITRIRAKYGPKYHQKVGEMLTRIPGVCALYLVYGEIDFYVLIRSEDNDDFLRKLERIINMPEIERSNTEIVAKVIKSEHRIDLSESRMIDSHSNATGTT